MHQQSHNKPAAFAVYPADYDPGKHFGERSTSKNGNPDLKQKLTRAAGGGLSLPNPHNESQFRGHVSRADETGFHGHRDPSSTRQAALRGRDSSTTRADDESCEGGRCQKSRPRRAAVPGECLLIQAASTRQGQKHQLEGTVVTISGKNAFIEPNTKLPACYNQKDVFFDVTKTHSGHFGIKKGDTVAFSLGTKNMERPMAFSVRLINCRMRTPEAIMAFICDLRDHIEQIDENAPDPSIFEYLISAVSCQAVWDSIGRCSSLENKEMDTLLQLLVNLEEVTKSMPAVFTRTLETLSTTPMFNSRDGRLKTFAANCFASQNHAAVSHLQGFLLMFMQHVPQKMRTVVALIKPIISRNKKSTEHFLYAILRRTTQFSTTDTENMEWDELPLVPSISELLDGPLEGDINLRPVKTEGPYDSAHDYIDTYFRLLRADCFDALKKGIADLLTGKLDPRDMNVYQDVNLAGLQITQNDSGLALGLKVTPVRKVHNWETSSSLMFGNLVCLSPSGTFRDALWATVMNRNLLKSHQIVMVELCSDCNSISDSQAVMLLASVGEQTVMVESPTYYRAYQPVLKSLQNLDPEKLPFQEELVHVEKAYQIPRYTDQYEGEATVNGRLIYSNVGQVDALAFALTEDSIGKTTLDISQEGAIKQALMRRVAIIQGPPGTGKTFIGIKLVQLLLSMNCIPDRPILVLTYKNHALDEFLKGLLQAGINEIIRVGGRSQDPALQDRNLNEVEKSSW